MFHKPVSSFPNCGEYRKFKWNGNHTGDDYPSAVGSYVCAVLDGEIVLSQELNGFGSLDPSTHGGCIIIKHIQVENVCSNKNFYGVYGHLIRLLGVGAKVRKGQVIGTIRSFKNGGSSCPHLHFGIYTGNVMPTNHLGYNSDLTHYHDPDTWLVQNAVSENMSTSAELALWEPILQCKS